MRAGYGILTDEPITGIVTNLNANPPFAQPFSATPTAANMLSLLNAATVSGFSGLAPTTINRHFDNPYVQEWNLNVERQITPSLGFTAAYVGSEGTHLRVARNINQLELESGADCVTVSPCLVRSFPTLSAGSPIRPGAGLGNIIEADSPGTSSYNALWLTLNKRFSRGLQFNASYTFSKSLDDVSQNNNTVLLQNSLDVGDARSLSDFDALRPIYCRPCTQLAIRRSGSATLSPAQPTRVHSPVFFLHRLLNRCCPIVPLRQTLPSPTHARSATYKRLHFGDLPRTNFGNPVLNVQSGSFGDITSTRFPTGDSGSSRQLQFALKLLF